jgi:DNA-binding sugar fermentation-stimulating protein
MHGRLKTTEVKRVREELRTKQGNRCGLCQLPVTESEAVLDHDHNTGAIRSTLHRGCNALLGKVENNHKRYGVRSLAAFCTGVSSYLQQHAINRTGLIHPSFRTEDEKREQRNKKARARRAAATRT